MSPDLPAKFAFVDLNEKGTGRITVDFLRHLAAAVAYRIHMKLTPRPQTYAGWQNATDY